MDIDVYNNYTIDTPTLTVESKVPKFLFIILLSLVSIAANTGIMMILINLVLDFNFSQISIVVAVILGVAILLLGYIGGFLWEVIGKIIAKSFYVAYLPEVKDNLLGKLYRRFIDADNKIFLEARSSNERLNGPVAIGKLILRISISEVAFYIAITALLLDSIIPRQTLRDQLKFYADYGALIDVFIALGLSVAFIGLYLPMSFIMDDSNLRTFDVEERWLDTPGSKIRSYIDGIAGISALSSGWAIFGDVRANYNAIFVDDTGYIIFHGSNTITVFLDYIAWIVVICVISWPLIFPAVLYFMRRYMSIINSFRAQANLDGIKVGVTMIRPPEGSEQEVIKEYQENTKHALESIAKKAVGSTNSKSETT